jgi:hypothetical protein
MAMAFKNGWQKREKHRAMPGDGLWKLEDVSEYIERHGPKCARTGFATVLLKHERNCWQSNASAL